MSTGDTPPPVTTSSDDSLAELTARLRAENQQVRPGSSISAPKPRSTDGWWLYGPGEQGGAALRSAVPMEGHIIKGDQALPVGCTYDPTVAIRWVRDGGQL